MPLASFGCLLLGGPLHKAAQTGEVCEGGDILSQRGHTWYPTPSGDKMSLVRDKASSVSFWTTEAAPNSPFVPLQHWQAFYARLRHTRWTQKASAPGVSSPVGQKDRNCWPDHYPDLEEAAKRKGPVGNGTTPQCQGGGDWEARSQRAVPP